MSSYELLELLSEISSRSKLRTAMRGGELAPEDQMIRHGINEVTRLRAIMNAVHGGKPYAPIIYLSHKELREFEEEQMALADGREQMYSFADRGYQTQLEELEEVSQDSHSH